MKDRQIKKLIDSENKRQKKVINLIASENIVSKDVLIALGSTLTNKYSEGYSGNRFYAGNEIVDKIENLAIERARKLFNLKESQWHVNVQALSGSPANLAVISAIVPAGEKIAGMKLSSGGHLTHGHSASMTGKWWKQVGFEVNNITGLLDYDAIKKIVEQEKPKMIIAGFTAYPRLIDFKKFREIADSVNAHLHVDMSHFAGLVAGKAIQSPFEYADTVMTTTHKTLRGPRGAIIFTKKQKDLGVDEKGKQILQNWEKIDKAVFPGLQGGPHDNQTVAIAVALKEASSSQFKKYAKQVIKNSKVLSENLIKLGWRLSSNGTDTHLILMDTYMDGKGLSGQIASDELAKNNIIVNKNALPGDKRSVFDPSGIRIGTAAETTKGKKEKDMVVLAKKIDKILKDKIKKIN